ncbi:hypothetical protein C0J45_9709 [Silurus meridionalis]|nr:hypothetical protein C0J45_9709 [Silurus meridionalis]
MASMDYEEVTAFLGEWGPFQLGIFLLLSLSIVPNGYAGMAMVFLGDTPDFRCLSPHLNASRAEAEGGARASTTTNVTGTLDGCVERVNGSSGPCASGWEYSAERYHNTIVTEWNLVCGDAWKVPFTLSIFFVGVLSGSFISGELSDRFGRKTVLFATMATQLICSLLQCVSVNWEMFIVFFCLTGFGQNSNYMAAFVLGKFIPESPRWLLSKGRVQEAEDIIRAAARKNGITPPEVIFKDSELIKSEVKFTITISYFGLCLSTPNMNGDPYLNCLFSALTEVAAYIMTWLLIKVVPRRALITGPLLSGGLVLLLIPAVPPDYGSATVALAMLGKLGVTAAFAVLYISTAEQFPTVVRGMGMGICSMCSKIGSTISPFFPYFGK